MTQDSKYWIYGKHTAISAIKNTERTSHRLVLTENNIHFLASSGIDINKLKYPYKILSSKEISALISKENATHQGIALEVTKLDEPNLIEVILKESNVSQKKSTEVCSSEKSSERNDLKQLEQKSSREILLILDQITDPHNIGAIIRSAAVFGVKAIIKTKDNFPSENATILKSACGAFEAMPCVTVTNLTESIKILKKYNYWIVGMSLNTELELNSKNNLLSQYDKIALVLGAEDTGIRKLVEQNCDLLAKISMMYNEEFVESLNVSNAAAIALYMLRNY